MPHWFIQVSTVRGTVISGTIAFVGQDGQTGFAQSFAGSISQGLASLTFSQSGARTALVNARSHPPTIALAGCTSYLQDVVSLTQCSFRHAADIQGN
jgi:hypothetical protein